MSIEQEINRNTMTIAELVKAVRELTEAIKGAGMAAAKAGTAVADFARLVATPRAVIDTDRVGAVSSTKTTIAPVADESPIEQGPFFWSHPATGSFGWLGTREEMRACFAQNEGCTEITGDQYDELVTADLKADEAKAAKPADDNRYFHDTVHRAAYKIAPTEPLNGLQARAGVEEINAEQYAVLKAEYTKITEQVIAGNAKAALAVPTAAPVDTPPSAPAAAAPSPTVTSSEPPPSAPEPAASPAEPAYNQGVPFDSTGVHCTGHVDYAPKEPAPPVAEPTWPEVHATLMRLVKTAGCGSTALIALLKDFGVERPKTALALQTEAVGRFAEIIANAELRMKGGAA